MFSKSLNVYFLTIAHIYGVLKMSQSLFYVLTDLNSFLPHRSIMREY